MHSKTVCTVISILERTIVHTNIQKFDWKTVQGAGIITLLVQHRWVTVIPVHRWVTVHCALVGHCAVCTGHRKTAISELDVLLNAIKETSVVHTGERILSDSVQMYNCTVGRNQCNCSRARGTLAIKTQLD